MFSAKEIKKKIEDLDEDLKSVQDQYEFNQTKMQRIINSNPQIQMCQQESNQLIAQLNRINGKKDVFVDMLEMLEPKKKGKDPK